MRQQLEKQKAACVRDGPPSVEVRIERLDKSIKLLCDHGADASAKDVRGRTCVHAAAIAGHAGTCATLAEACGADVNRCDQDGNTPLHLAIAPMNPAVCTALVSVGAHVHNKNSNKASVVDLVLADHNARPLHWLTRGA